MIGNASLWVSAPPPRRSPHASDAFDVPDMPDASSRAQRRANGFVILDRAWAVRLDVRRVCGVYRIRRRELVERLERLQREEMGRSLNADWPPAPSADSTGPVTGRAVR